MVRGREAEEAARKAAQREEADRLYERLKKEIEEKQRAREEEDELINLLRQVSLCLLFRLVAHRAFCGPVPPVVCDGWELWCLLQSVACWCGCSYLLLMVYWWLVLPWFGCNAAWEAGQSLGCWGCEHQLEHG